MVSHEVRGQRTKGSRKVWGNVLMTDQIHTMTRVQCLLHPIPRHRIPTTSFSQTPHPCKKIQHFLANTEANRSTVYSPQTKIPQQGSTGNKIQGQTWNPSVSHVCSSTSSSRQITSGNKKETVLFTIGNSQCTVLRTEVLFAKNI